MKGGLEKFKMAFFSPSPDWPCAVIGLDKSLMDILKYNFSLCCSYDQGTTETREKPKPQIS